MDNVIPFPRKQSPAFQAKMVSRHTIPAGSWEAEDPQPATPRVEDDAKKAREFPYWPDSWR